jgi:hypothetical protein
MEIKFDVRFLSPSERNHIAQFVQNWPDQQEIPDAPKSEVLFSAAYVAGATAARGARLPETEEQRLDDEQKKDLSDSAPSFADVAASLIAQEDTRASTSQPLSAPPPPAPPAVPSVPTAAQATDNPAPVDKEGLPWDARIHSSSRAIIADGTWKLRRGVDPTEVASVKSQLKSLMALPAPETQAPPPPVPAARSHYLADQPGFQQQVTMTDLIGRMSASIVAGKLTPAQINEACAKHGVSEFILLSSRPDLVPIIDAEMKALGV